LAAVTRRAALVSLVLVLCLAPSLAGCGGGGDEGKVKSVVNQLYAGFAERDANKVCNSLTKGRQKVVAGKARNCAQAMGIALGLVGSALKDAKQAKVTKVQLNGAKARATVSFKGKSSDLGVAKEGGDWKISDLNLGKL
jgi:hypothetical protein